MSRPQLLEAWPTKPHVAVLIGCNIGEADKVPILEMPTRLPLDEPFGPRREARPWEELHDRVREAHRYLEVYLTSQPERLQILNQLYAEFVQLFEIHVCERTDTPLQRRSRRCRAPRIRWVQAETRSKQHFKSWHTLERPLHWMQRWIQDVLRFLEAPPDADNTLDTLQADLDDCPAEYRSVPALIGLMAQARLHIAALASDTARLTALRSLAAWCAHGARPLSLAGRVCAVASSGCAWRPRTPTTTTITRLHVPRMGTK